MCKEVSHLFFRFFILFCRTVRRIQILILTIWSYFLSSIIAVIIIGCSSKSVKCLFISHNSKSHWKDSESQREIKVYVEFSAFFGVYAMG